MQGKKVLTPVTAPHLLSPRSNVDSLWTWLVIGACAAGLPAILVTVGLDTRYVLYGTLGIALAVIAPYVVAVAGSAERVFWLLFVLALQGELAWTPIRSQYQKVAGPYGLMITPLLLAGLVLVAIWLSYRYLAHGDRLRVPRSFIRAALLFLGTGLASTTKSPDHTLSAFGSFEILSLILTAVVASNQCSRRTNVTAMRSALLVVLFVQGLSICVEQVSGVQVSLAHGINTLNEGGVEGRFAGTFGAASTAATFINVCLFALFGTIFSKQKPRHAPALWCLFCLGFLALLLARTRSAWIGFTIGSIGLMWGSYRRRTLSRRLLGRLIAGGLIALMVAWPLASKRLGEDQRQAVDTRENLALIAVAMIKAHPVVGIGLNTATNQVYSYAQSAGIGGWIFIVHNQFLLVAAETGLPGLIAFLLVIWVGIRAAWDCMRCHDTLITETGTVLFWSLIAMVWALNIDHVSGCMTYALLWFLIGASCGLDILRRREESSLQGLAAAAPLPLLLPE